MIWKLENFRYSNKKNLGKNGRNPGLNFIFITFIYAGTVPNLRTLRVCVFFVSATPYKSETLCLPIFIFVRRGTGLCTSFLIPIYVGQDRYKSGTVYVPRQLKVSLNVKE